MNSIKVTMHMMRLVGIFPNLGGLAWLNVAWSGFGL